MENGEKCFLGLAHILRNHAPGLPLALDGASVVAPTTSEQADLGAWAENPLDLPTRKSPQNGGCVEKCIFAPARTFAAEQKVTYRIRGPAGLEAAILNF